MSGTVQSIVEFLKYRMSKELVVFIISMIPILELRGSLLAAGFLKMKFLSTYLLAVVGNMLPIPFILIFIDKIFLWLKKTPLKKVILWLEKRAISKSDIIEKYRQNRVLEFHTKHHRNK